MTGFRGLERVGGMHTRCSAVRGQTMAFFHLTAEEHLRMALTGDIVKEGAKARRGRRAKQRRRHVGGPRS